MKKEDINERVYEIRTFVNIFLCFKNLSDSFVISIFGQNFLDAFYRVQEFADGVVVIQVSMIRAMYLLISQLI